MSDNPTDPTRIERDLNQTRSRLGSHLSELQDRLSPGQVVDDLMGYFRGSEGAEFGRSLLENVRGNPMPAALTGIGLAWLMASNPRAGASHASAVPAGDGVRSSGSPGYPHVYGREDFGATLNRVQRAEMGVSREADEADHAYSARLDHARGQAIGLARHEEETTESFGSRVRDALASAQQSITDTAQGLRSQAGSAVSSASGVLGSLTSSTRDAVQYAGGAVSQGGKAAGQAGGNLVAALTESPVLLGALGLAAGALLGALLPQSDQEEAALGGIAGQARDTATNLATQGMESGRNVAQAVAATARDSAQGHGLTAGKTAGQLVDAALSGELAGQAKDVLQDAMRSGGEAVRREVGQADGAPPPT